MIESFVVGGSIMWMILVLSIVSFAVVIERLWFFKQSSCDPEKLEVEVGKALFEKNDNELHKLLDKQKSSMHRLFSVAINHWSTDTEDMKLLLNQQVRRELYRWEKHLFVLEIIGKIAPLLGLLGTVLGMSEMFQSLHLGGQVSSTAVTGGIWKALFTTIAGLTVAIPTIFVHGILTSRIDNQEETLNRAADFLIREQLLRSESNEKK
ncbi:MAG: MotA/TolQ/ExbB proton channel family protein [Synergistaceae bacterium]